MFAKEKENRKKICFELDALLWDLEVFSGSWKSFEEVWEEIFSNIYKSKSEVIFFNCGFRMHNRNICVSTISVDSDCKRNIQIIWYKLQSRRPLIWKVHLDIKQNYRQRFKFLNHVIFSASAVGLKTYICQAVLRIRIRDPVPFWPLDPGSGIGFFRISDPGSRIPDPWFRIPDPEPIFLTLWELRDNFLGEKFYNSLKIGPNFFLQHFKNKTVQFCEIYYSKKMVWQQIFFHQCLSLLSLDTGSGMGQDCIP